MDLSELQKSIEGLYHTFAVKQAPASIDRCPHCMNEQEAKDLLRQDLASIPEAELWSYAFDVFYTVGAVEDFRYFLPRILELVSQHAETDLDPEMVLCKLTYADWLNWPAEEQAAIERFLKAAFWALLNGPADQNPHEDGNLIDSWLCGLSRSGLSISAFLEILEYPRNQTQKKQLLAFVQDDDEYFSDKETWWFPSDGDKEPFADQLDVNRKLFFEWVTGQ